MLNTQSQVTAIVPGYNEEQTIGGVIKILVESSLFSEVIAVTDGSMDQTAEQARAAGATRVLHGLERLGKGLAMRQGALVSLTPFIFFCDADLLGFKAEHISMIIDPVLGGQADMCVDLHDRGPVLTWLMQYLPLIGGERIIRREHFLAIPQKYLEGYRVEIAMNAYCRSRGLKIKTCKLEGLHLRRKMQKMGFWRGLHAYLGMTLELIHAVWIIRLAQLRGQF